MRTFRHGEVDLAYDEFEGPGNQPLVFLSGLGSARRQWRPFVVNLADRHRVFTLDHRGHGDSSHAPATSYSLAGYGGDLTAFCEEVVGQAVVLVGHSLGGVVAHHVACSRPDLVRGVFLVDPPLFSEADTGRPGPSAFFPEIRRVLRTAQGRGTTVEQYAATLRSLSPAPGHAAMGDVLSDNVLRGMAQEQLRLDPEVFTAPILRTAFAGLDPAKRVPCAVAVLRADPEKLAAFTAEDERRFRATNPHATVDVVPGAGHVLHADAPQEFSAHLDRFLLGLV